MRIPSDFRLLFALLVCCFPFAEGLHALAEPSVSVIHFSDSNDVDLRIENGAEPAMILDATWSAGRLVGDSKSGLGQLEFAADLPFAAGSLAIDLNRDSILSDLALVLDADLTTESDLSFQLFNAAGQGLALDLFGQVEANASAVGTDTFIIPLARYPEATRLVIRRLSGPIVLRQLAFIPVLSAFENTPELEASMAETLGVELARSSLFSDKEEKPSVGKIHHMPRLETINAIGAAALADAGYPRYAPLTESTGGGLFIPVSGTVYDFAKLADRSLAMDGGEKSEFFFTSSSGVLWYFPGSASASSNGRPGRAELGLASVPFSTEKKQAFESERGYPVIEIPIARSAIEVLVQADNPIDSLTEWQLSAAFSGVGQAQTWADLGVEDENWAHLPLRVYGGNHSWGTGRVFRELALKGNPWRADMEDRYDVVYSHGVERMVAENEGGIGYAAQRTRVHLVKPLRLAPRGGGDPVVATEASIYSGKYPLQRRLYAYVDAPSLAEASPEVREWINLILSAEGQTLMVRSNFLPLASQEVEAWRNFLELD